MSSKMMTAWVGMGLFLIAATAHAAVDLQVDKSVDVIRPSSMTTVEYTVMVSNKGDTDASGAKVTDLLPAGLSYISDDEPDGKYDPVTGVWDIGAVAAGGQKILKIIALVN
jgi:uncharacterized repeat protein (TIGR01451 family)